MQKKKTRMHSSRTRTGRSLTVFRSLLLRGGCLLPGGGCLLLGGGVCSRGVCSQGGLYPPGPGGGLPGQITPPPCEQNEWQTGVKILPWPKLRFGRLKKNLTPKLKSFNTYYVKYVGDIYYMKLDSGRLPLNRRFNVNKTIRKLKRKSFYK